MAHSIMACEAAELYEMDNGERHNDFTRVDVQLVRTSRWMEHYWLVVTRGEGFFGVTFALGLTESQENDFPWEDCDPHAPIELTPLVPVEITRTEYQAAPA